MKKIICLMLAMLVMMSCALPVFADTTIPGAGTEINDTPQKKWNAFFTYEDFRFNKLDADHLVSWYHDNAKKVAPYDQCNYLLTCKTSQKYGTAQIDDVYEIFVFPKSVSSLTFDSENMCFELPVGTEYYVATFFTRTYIEKAEFSTKNANSYKVTTTDKAYTFFPGCYEDQRVLLLRNDFDIIDKSTGDKLDSSSSKKEFFYDFDYDEDYNCNMKVSTTSKKDYLVGFTLSNKDGVHLPYSFFGSNGRYSLSKSQPVKVSWNVKQFYDDFQDVPDYTDDVIIGVSVSTYSEEDDRYNIVDFHIEKINIQDILSQDHSLFAEKKDYVEFPSIEDYIQEFPDFPAWDTDHPLDSIWNIVKWVGDCLVVVGKNLIGLIKWLGACLWTIIENIGIALYNLVVDIRRLLIYLFVPDSTKLQNLIKDKFPAFLKIESSIKAGQNSNSNTSINLFGHSFDFDFSDMPDSIKSFMYTGSTIFLYATQVFMVVKMAMKFFGVSAGGEEE